MRKFIQETLIIGSFVIGTPIVICATILVGTAIGKVAFNIAIAIGLI